MALDLFFQTITPLGKSQYSINVFSHSHQQIENKHRIGMTNEIRFFNAQHKTTYLH